MSPGARSGPLDTIRIVGSGGANRAMEAELKRLAPRVLGRIRLPKLSRVDGQTLTLPFSPELAWLAVACLRTPSRILWDLGWTAATRLEPLYEDVTGFIGPAPPWLMKRGTLSVDVRHIDHIEAGPLQVRGTIKNALVDRAKALGANLRLAPDDPDLAVWVRGEASRTIVSLDLGGQSLHRRGYRLDRGDAPLKENVAAQMVMLSRWRARDELLVDPMCGSGTIPIEAHAMARGEPPWSARRPPRATRLPVFAEFNVPEPLFGDTEPHIVASDIDPAAMKAARANAKRARARGIRFDERDYRTWTREALLARAGAASDVPILVLTNPPYGERLVRDDDADRELADWWRTLGPNTRIALLTPDGEAKSVFGPQPSLEKPLWNGPLRARFLVYQS